MKAKQYANEDVLIEALVDLYLNGPCSENLGICYHVQQFIELYEVEGWIMENLMNELFMRWPEFSGSLTYPVPGPEGELARAAFNARSIGPHSMWTGEYGAKRWALAEFMLRNLVNGAA